MIKTLFFISALLLLPGLGYAGNPSAPFSDQVVPADPPSSVACGYGPNYSGSIPAPAQAAGFNTCAVNLDFGSAALSNPATYIDCMGAGSPILSTTSSRSLSGMISRILSSTAWKLRSVDSILVPAGART